MKVFIALIFTTIFFSCASQKNTINFEKVVYNSSRCFGDCPIIHLEVKKDKTLRLSKMKTLRMSKYSADDNSVKKIEKEEFKFYKGKVNDELYNQLLTELAKTDTLILEGRNCCDAPMKTIIAYYNGKRKYIKTMFPPAQGENLFGIFRKISESENQVDTSEKFEFETEVVRE